MLIVLAIGPILPVRVQALVVDAQRIREDAAPGAFPIYANGNVAPLVMSASDDPAVQRAVRSLQSDIERVTSVRPNLKVRPTAGDHVILVGTLGQSGLIDRLVAQGKLDVSAINGRWEAFVHQVVPEPFPGVAQALVIAGSDRRGTVYGIYTLSEQIGVSPWHWWADVPVPLRDALYYEVVPLVETGPVVKYRGIFLNDEAPALSGWAYEKFGGFNASFYEHVFELILRLRGNTLWPAMWGRAFAVDDPKNPALAHEFGIVIGTSHHEPLMRAHSEWKSERDGRWDYASNGDRLREFWRGGLERVKDFETIITIGMRGDGDEPMSDEANVALLEQVVADQRDIIRDVHERNPEEVPQLWALYKEVQSYYERGMRVPDDVTLLWADDNWGNIRRLPTAAERGRRGGAGVYYHFDYVGGPRNYKWINVTPITKIWEQMHLAWRHEATRIWIVNVGDLKPMEFPTEFFLTYAWDPARWPYERLREYSEAWAARDFGTEHAAEIAALINGYSKLNRRRTPELVTPATLSLLHEREAERVLAEWSDLVDRARRLEALLPAEARDAYFQLVLYPVEASANVWQINIAAARNQLYVRHGNIAANAEAEHVRRLFDRAGELVDRYHQLGDGRWNHQMAQIKLGYTSWQEPVVEAAPAVQWVRPKPRAEMAVSIQGSERAWPSHGAPKPVLPPLDPYRGGTRWIDVFNRGSEPVTFTVTCAEPWVVLTPARGVADPMVRVEVGVDWDRVPADASEAMIVISDGRSRTVSVQLPLARPPAPPAGGFVEVEKQVAMEAPHFTRSVSREGVRWNVLENFGRTVGGVTLFSGLSPDQDPTAGACLEYDLEFVSSGEVTVELHCAPSLDFQPDDGLRLAVSFDDDPPRELHLGTGDSTREWERAVADSIRRITSTHKIANPGRHVFKLWGITPGVVVERIVLDFGGKRPTYLGPIESPRGPVN